MSFSPDSFEAKATAKGDLEAASSATAAARLAVGTNGQVLYADSTQTVGMRWADRTIVLPTLSYPGTIAVSTSATRIPIIGQSWSILGALAMVGTAPTGAAIIIDILKNGTTIYTGGTGRPTIATTAFTSGSYTTPAVTSLSFGDYLTVTVAQIGSTVAGADLTVAILVKDLS